MALKSESVLVGKHAGQHTGYGVRKYQRGQLAAGENIIAYGNFFINDLVDDPLVNALIVAAQQRNIIELRQLLDPLLGQGLALRRHIDKMRALAELIAKRHEAVVDGLSLHYHTCAAAVGRVIHTVMLIFRIIADIAAVYLDAAVLSRSADYAFAEHAEAHIGKES